MEKSQTTQYQSTPLTNQNIKISLEKLLSKIPKQKESTLESIFHDKSKSLKNTVNELLEEIELRKDLDYKILKKIDDTILKETNVLLNIENHYVREKDLEEKEFEEKIKGNVFDLEKEKRKEYLECWRDMMNINKYLMSAFKEYWDFTRNKGLITNNNS